jgi:hypothetical protein
MEELCRRGARGGDEIKGGDPTRRTLNYIFDLKITSVVRWRKEVPVRFHKIGFMLAKN